MDNTINTFNATRLLRSYADTLGKISGLSITVKADIKEYCYQLTVTDRETGELFLETSAYTLDLAVREIESIARWSNVIDCINYDREVLD